MKATKQVLLFLSGLCLGASAEAVGPTATASFYIQDRETEQAHPRSGSTAGSACLSDDSRQAGSRR